LVISKIREILLKCLRPKTLDPDFLLAIEEVGVSVSTIKRSDMFLKGREVNLVTLPNVINMANLLGGRVGGERKGGCCTFY
jgi:hypothetical protein